MRIAVEESARTRQDSPFSPQKVLRHSGNGRLIIPGAPRPGRCASVQQALAYPFVFSESRNVIGCLLASGESLVLRKYSSVSRVASSSDGCRECR